MQVETEGEHVLFDHHAAARQEDKHGRHRRQEGQRATAPVQRADVRAQRQRQAAEGHQRRRERHRVGSATREQRGDQGDLHGEGEKDQDGEADRDVIKRGHVAEGQQKPGDGDRQRRPRLAPGQRPRPAQDQHHAQARQRAETEAGGHHRHGYSPDVVGQPRERGHARERGRRSQRRQAPEAGRAPTRIHARSPPGWGHEFSRRRLSGIIFCS